MRTVINACRPHGLLDLDDQKCQLVTTTGVLSNQTVTVCVLNAVGTAVDTAFKATVTSIR